MADRTEPTENAVRPDFYETLGVAPTATPDEIREAYWRQVRIQSADREPGQRARTLARRIRPQRIRRLPQQRRGALIGRVEVEVRGAEQGGGR